MTDNITKALLAQLLMEPPQGPRSNGSAYPAVPYWMPPDPAEDFISHWPSDDEFESRAPEWFIRERLRNLVPIRPPEPPPDLQLDHRRLNDPFRRRFEEFDAGYLRRPLQRR